MAGQGGLDVVGHLFECGWSSLFWWAQVRSEAEVEELVQRGMEGKTMGSNYRHEHSSRSHTVIRLVLQVFRHRRCLVHPALSGLGHRLSFVSADQDAAFASSPLPSRPIYRLRLACFHRSFRLRHCLCLVFSSWHKKPRG